MKLKTYFIFPYWFFEERVGAEHPEKAETDADDPSYFREGKI